MSTTQILATCRALDARPGSAEPRTPDPARERLRQWCALAREHGWSGLDVFANESLRVYGSPTGFGQCQHCGSPVVCPSISAGNWDSEAVELSSGETLCRECHDAAAEARAKIVVYSDDTGVWEDRGDMTDEDRALAGFLDRAEDAENRRDREFIRESPSRERRHLRRYQDEIERDRFMAGKQIGGDA